VGGRGRSEKKTGGGSSEGVGLGFLNGLVSLRRGQLR